MVNFANCNVAELFSHKHWHFLIKSLHQDSIRLTIWQPLPEIFLDLADSPPVVHFVPETNRKIIHQK